MAGLLKPRNTSGPVLRCLALLGLLTARSFTPGAAADSPAPLNPIQALAVQRSAALFAASTPTHAFPVRVVIYGQSISQQWWSWDILRELPWWHPDTVFTGENRSITSFDTDYLIQTAEADIFAFRPDLIIFQAYGPYGAGLGWEKILRAFRARTTADVILVGNHPLLDAELEEPTEPALIPPNTQAWLNYIFTPALTGELGFCFPDNRSLWKAYLRTNQLPASALLKDTIHFTPPRLGFAEGDPASLPLCAIAQSGS